MAPALEPPPPLPVLVGLLVGVVPVLVPVRLEEEEEVLERVATGGFEAIDSGRSARRDRR